MCAEAVQLCGTSRFEGVLRSARYLLGDQPGLTRVRRGKGFSYHHHERKPPTDAEARITALRKTSFLTVLFETEFSHVTAGP